MTAPVGDEELNKGEVEALENVKVDADMSVIKEESAESSDEEPSSSSEEIADEGDSSSGDEAKEEAVKVGRENRNNFVPTQPASDGGGDAALNASVVQFLALYLLVLAFFIWLVSLARFEGVKSLAVINSLKSTFETVEKKTENIEIRTLIRSKISTSKQFQDNIKGLFSTLLGVEKVEAPTPGQTMRVVMKADSLFEKGAIVIKPLNYNFMDRVVASLSERPPGYHFDMEFVIGSKEDASGYGTLPINQTLQMARAGAFVRSMLARGAPPDTVSVGIRKGDPSSVALWFYIRSPTEIDTYYYKLRNPRSQESNSRINERNANSGVVDGE